MLTLKPHRRDLGGFAVQRLLPAFPTKMVGPFIFFDHFGPVAFAPGEGADVRPHPHIGLRSLPAGARTCARTRISGWRR